MAEPEIIHAKLFRKMLKGFKWNNKALTGYCQFLINTVVVFYNEPYKCQSTYWAMLGE